MKRRKPTYRETIIKAIADASRALDIAYRHPHVTSEDKRRILGVLYELHVGNGEGLKLTREGK